jgi:hypothetical protein
MTCISTYGRAAFTDAARLRRKSAAFLAGAVALASVAVCARADAGGPAPRQIAEVGEICRTIIGLEPGGAQYEACASSLADSLHSRDHAAAQAQIALPSAGAEPAASGSYFYASQREVYRREQLSCTRLGLAPADGAFADCVANLDGRLFEADNPTQ